MSGDPLRRAAGAVRVQFGVLGMLCGLWGAHIPSVKARYGLDEAGLAAVLFCAALGAVAMLFAAGRVIGRLGARDGCRVAGTAACAALAGILLFDTPWLLVPLMLVFGAGQSLYDVAINTEGTALEALSGRPLMGGLHGMFSVGGMAGAGVAALLIGLGVAPWLQFVGGGAALAAALLAAAPGMLPVHPPAGEGEAHFAWPRGRLLVIGLLIFAGMTAEGVMYDWSVLYLKQELQVDASSAALGYAVFAGAMAAARFGGDGLRARWDEARIVAVGASVAAAAMAVVLLAGRPAVAFAGYALVGVGVALIVPILYNAATRVPGVARAAAIASVSSIGYAGFMVGPPLIGGIAKATTLTHAMAVVALAAAVLAAGARAIPPVAVRTPG